MMRSLLDILSEYVMHGYSITWECLDDPEVTPTIQLTMKLREPNGQIAYAQGKVPMLDLVSTRDPELAIQMYLEQMEHRIKEVEEDGL